MVRAAAQDAPCKAARCAVPTIGIRSPRTAIRLLSKATSGEGRWHTRWVAAEDIDSYLAAVDEPKRSTLKQLRRRIQAVIPDAEECLSYGMPAFKVEGKTVAGFAAFKNHLSYLPHSGSVLLALAHELAGYEGTKGSLHFPIDQPLPAPLVNKLVGARLRELGL
jgi:uncharacterized protein YdhG (YjbR/CyaY superfamily)